MGCREYEAISARYRVPIVITGFEPLDILAGVLKVVRQLEDGHAEVENQYNRVVKRGAMTPPQIWSKGCS
jgi:hydrogenase expression/formation protein HypD